MTGATASSRRPFFFGRSLASGGADGLSVAVSSETRSQLDPTTLTAIRESLAAAQKGRLVEACATAEQALANGGDATALNAMLGMLRTKAGDTEGAIRHLQLAHRAQPSDLRIAGNLASALAGAGDFRQAMDVASAERARADLQIARVRGYAAQMLVEPSSAIEAYEHVVASVPDDWESWNNLGNARLALDDAEGGIAALRRSVELNPNAAPARLNLTRALRKAGEFAEAERQLRSMADHFDDDIMSLTDLRDLLQEQGRPDEEVMEVLWRTLERAPENEELLLSAARKLVQMLDMEQAEELFRRILRRQPANSSAFVGLAIVYEHVKPGRFDELADEAERSGADADTVNLLRAFAHRRAKRFDEGLAALAQVPEELEPARRAEMLGQFHQGLGDYDRAFAAFSRMNEVQAESQSDPLTRAEKLRGELRERLDRTTADWVAEWRTPPIAPERASPIFLVGFPRSGTTLLDTILMGHPELAVMEEQPVLTRVAVELGGFEKLPELSEEQIRAAQRRYFDVAGEYVRYDEGQVLVDKSPLLLNAVPIIHRLFPDARFILALRHPADALISCFVSNFRLNSSMSNFLRLDTAAEFYDLTFKNWENATALLPIEVHQMVYERLVDDPEPELRRLSHSLGLSWNDEMLDHRKTAGDRGVIPTASYAQVTEPIYRSSVGRWRNYRTHLEPILPVLAPWAEKFGYEL